MAFHQVQPAEIVVHIGIVSRFRPHRFELLASFLPLLQVEESHGQREARPDRQPGIERERGAELALGLLIAVVLEGLVSSRQVAFGTAGQGSCRRRLILALRLDSEGRGESDQSGRNEREFDRLALTKKDSSRVGKTRLPVCRRPDRPRWLRTRTSSPGYSSSAGRILA